MFVKRTPIKTVVILLSIIISGCSTVKVPEATSGSKADATVELSYEYGGFERPVVDWGQAALKARNKCKAWGFKNAEPFEPSQPKCSYQTQDGCLRNIVIRKYQCIN